MNGRCSEAMNNAVSVTQFYLIFIAFFLHSVFETEKFYRILWNSKILELFGMKKVLVAATEICSVSK